MTTSKEVIIISDEKIEREEAKIDHAMPLLNDVPSKMTKEEEVYFVSNDEKGPKNLKIVEAIPLIDIVSMLTI